VRIPFVVRSAVPNTKAAPEAAAERLRSFRTSSVAAIRELQLLSPVLSQFLDKERHAIRTIDNLFSDLPGQRFASSHICYHLGALLGAKRLRLTIVTWERPITV
jgi:hypothetical protein